MLPAQRFWRETVLLIYVMWPRSNQWERALLGKNVQLYNKKNNYVTPENCFFQMLSCRRAYICIIHEKDLRKIPLGAPGLNWENKTYKLRTCLHGGGGPQVVEVTRLGQVTGLSIWSLISMALMRDYVRRANFTTKPRLQGKFSAFTLFVRGYSFQIYCLGTFFYAKLRNFTIQNEAWWRNSLIWRKHA